MGGLCHVNLTEGNVVGGHGPGEVPSSLEVYRVLARGGAAVDADLGLLGGDAIVVVIGVEVGRGGGSGCPGWRY